MTQSQCRLVEANLDLISQCVYRRFFVDARFADISYDDLKQIGYLALCKAAICFDATRPEEDFFPYAKAAIYNELALCFRRIRERPKTVPLDALVEEYGDIPFSDPHQDEMFLAIENRDLLERHLKKSSGIYRTGLEAIILRMRGYTSEEIGRKYGKDRWYINAVISKTRKKMRADPELREVLCA